MATAPKKPFTPRPPAKPPKTHRVQYHTKNKLVETIFNPVSAPTPQFAMWRAADLPVEYLPSTPINTGGLYHPPEDSKSVSLPAAATEYGSTAELLSDIKGFQSRFVDIDDFTLEMMSHWTLLTWVFGAFHAIPYLRFMGDYGTGKTRCVQVVSALSYNSIMLSGATSVSPVFRLLDMWKGTLGLDEMDLKPGHNDVHSEITKILNNGYQKGIPVSRTNKEDNSLVETFDVYGPKVFSTREAFPDRATESRSLTFRTTHKRPDPRIPHQLPDDFEACALPIRNKALMWRFRNLRRMAPNESHLVKLDLPPRLIQIGTPLWTISPSDQFKEGLVDFLFSQAKMLMDASPISIVATALGDILQFAQVKSPWPMELKLKEISVKALTIAADIDAGLKVDVLSPRRVGEICRSMGLPTTQNTNRDTIILIENLSHLAEIKSRFIRT